MGAGASKAARRLPTNAPTGATTGTADAAMRAARAAAAEQAAADAVQQQQQQKQDARAMEYSSRPPRAEDAPFSGEKDEQILKDGMDPQFLANLARMGQVKVPEAGVQIPARPLRTLSARNPLYTTRTLTPPPGTVSAQTLSSLLDAFKSLPPGRDAEALYKRARMTKDQLKDVRRWVNSPSVADEATRVEEGANSLVHQVTELKAVWIDARDKDAPGK
ncbi:hypothetical protein CspeluHIS016_0201110 [Cutaneotrichosporon spelunceum]|uniref:Uncharacterized protein n=1 Tax=Cutaneotrichosporon spelunceum TaxID=1672016 RepID=A0AAD3Y9J8_9TREE|nr:hypothetical protein CspeluHIS016_0201110 [Cutaneotrichosporon spelunceum]